MTIKECIDRTDNLNPNQYSEEQKVAWLSELDCNIFTDIILTHYPYFGERPLPRVTPFSEDDDPARVAVPCVKPEFKPYSVDNMTEQLIAPFPYDNLYIAYLQMKIDEANKDSVQYNNSAIMFTTYYNNFSTHYNRTHKPINLNRFNMWRRG